jgi:hypothetical protein
MMWPGEHLVMTWEQRILVPMNTRVPLSDLRCP